MLNKLFNEHPHSVNETYWQHMVHATYFGSKMLFAGFACIVHAIFPFFFEKTGSKMITYLHNRMLETRATQKS